MERVLFIKNMVCDRCKMTVLNLLKTKGFEVKLVELGKVIVKEAPTNNYIELEKSLKTMGFELMKEEVAVWVEKIKIALIQEIDKGDSDLILSKITKDLGKNYAFLSKIFSKSEGITLEKYLIYLKIEKVKEYIQLNQLNFSEIAYSLNYKSSSHLAKQFKNNTGMSMTSYKKAQQNGRKSIDKIV